MTEPPPQPPSTTAPPPPTTTLKTSFLLNFLMGRWFYLFAAILIMSGAGATYLFAVYSKEIKATLGYDQTTLNLLGFFKDLGANVGVLSGLLDEVAPTWLVLLVGAGMNFVGYFMIYPCSCWENSKA